MRKILFIVFSILLTKAGFTQITYEFNGNGNWSDSANWINRSVPPAILQPGSEIIIDPSGDGECVLNIPQYILYKAKLTVKEGKKLTIAGSIDLPEQYINFIIGDTCIILFSPRDTFTVQPSVDPEGEGSYVHGASGKNQIWFTLINTLAGPPNIVYLFSAQISDTSYTRDTRFSQLTITEYGAPGGYISGSFNGDIREYTSASSDIIKPFTCAFRIKNQ